MARKGLRYWPAARKRHLKRAMLKAAHYKCRYCGCGVDYATATFDHIKPLAKNGKSTRENLCIACLDCNIKKADHIYEQPNT